MQYQNWSKEWSTADASTTDGTPHASKDWRSEKSDKWRNASNGNQGYGGNSWGEKKTTFDSNRGFGGENGYQEFTPMGYGSYGWDGRMYSMDGFGGYQAMSLEVMQQQQMSDIQKHFYEEHPEITAMPMEAVEAYRASKNMKIVSQKEKCPKPVPSFDKLMLPDYLRQMIANAGYTEPTPIQAQGWPIALSGRDMIGIAETGSGKTMAFLLPAVIHINAQTALQHNESGPICLVLAPTRELAQQIEAEARKVSQSSRLRCAVLVGGVPKGPQIGLLKRGCEIVIATPGRLLDLLNMQLDFTFNLNRVSYLCLDEADRMLDMGFERDLRKICERIRPDRQTLLWSATWPKEVEKLARDLTATDPVHIHIGEGELGELKGNPRITQNIIVMQRPMDDEKVGEIKNILALEKQRNSDETKPVKVIIFSMTKKGCDTLARKLHYERIGALAIHGDKSQQDRDWSLAQFKDEWSGYDVLCATDVAARGLDIKNVKAVVNFDFPLNIEDYVHRIGRTGRAGAEGTAYSFFCPDDLPNGRKSASDLISILQKNKQQVPEALVDLAGSYGGKGKMGGKFKGKGKQSYGYGKQQDSWNTGKGGGGFTQSRWY